MKLQDSVFLVTGGASGLGAATARMALEAGARVVVADLAAPAGWAGADASCVWAVKATRPRAATAGIRTLNMGMRSRSGV